MRIHWSLCLEPFQYKSMVLISFFVYGYSYVILRYFNTTQEYQNIFLDSVIFYQIFTLKLSGRYILSPGFTSKA